MKDYDGKRPIYVEEEPAKLRHFVQYGLVVAGLAAALGLAQNFVCSDHPASPPSEYIAPHPRPVL